MRFWFQSSVILLMSGLASFLSARMDVWIGFKNYQTPWSIALGVFCIALGLWIRFHCTKLFHEYKLHVVQLTSQHHLITNGMFAQSRNPLILAIGLIFLGSVFVFGSYIGLIAVTLFLVFWDIEIRVYEEPSLRRAFGKEYAEYMRKVPRWIVLHL